MVFLGLAFLVLSGLALYKLAPREGKASNPWMENEAVGIAVALALVTLLATGATLIIRSFA